MNIAPDAWQADSEALRARAQKAEARIQAVRDVLDWPHLDLDGDAVVHADDIRRALDGTDTPTGAG